MAEFWICAITAHPWIMTTKQHLRALGREEAESMDLSDTDLAEQVRSFCQAVGLRGVWVEEITSLVVTIRDAATAAERERCAQIEAALVTIAKADDPRNPRKWTMVGIATVARIALGKP